MGEQRIASRRFRPVQIRSPDEYHQRIAQVGFVDALFTDEYVIHKAPCRGAIAIRCTKFITAPAYKGSTGNPNHLATLTC